MFSGILNKILGIGVAILAAAAGFYKWRSDKNAEKARRQKERADGLKTKAQVQKNTVEAQKEISRKKREEKKEARKGKGGLDKWALVAVIFLAGCASDPIVLSPECEKPIRPDVPTVSEEELAPLPQDVRARVLTRDVLIREYAEKLEAACDEINAAADR